MAEPRKLIQELEVLNQQGIHARPAALIVQTASQFKSEIYMGKKQALVSAKSIMGLLTLEGHRGARLTVRIVGPDAEEAWAQLAELFQNKFFEE